MQRPHPLQEEGRTCRRVRYCEAKASQQGWASSSKQVGSSELPPSRDRCGRTGTVLGMERGPGRRSSMEQGAAGPELGRRPFLRVKCGVVCSSAPVPKKAVKR